MLENNIKIKNKTLPVIIRTVVSFSDAIMVFGIKFLRQQPFNFYNEVPSNKVSTAALQICSKPSTLYDVQAFYSFGAYTILV